MPYIAHTMSLVSNRNSQVSNQIELIIINVTLPTIKCNMSQ